MNSPSRPLTGLAILAAPILVLGYAAVRPLDPGHGPGPVWTASHLLLLAGFVAFGLAIPGLRRLAAQGSRARRVAVDAISILTLIGVVSAFGQTLTDIVVGLAARDRAGMSALFDQFHQYPGVGLAFGKVGPILFFVGLPALTTLLAVTRPPRVAPWAPAAVAIGALLPVVELNLLPLAAVLMVLGLAPLGWRLTHPSDRDKAADVAQTMRS